jgi:hypothetical protein
MPSGNGNRATGGFTDSRHDGDRVFQLMPPIERDHSRRWQKKTGMAEHTRVSCHAGILFNEPSGAAEVPFS